MVYLLMFITNRINLQDLFCKYIILNSKEVFPRFAFRLLADSDESSLPAQSDAAVL